MATHKTQDLSMAAVLFWVASSPAMATPMTISNPFNFVDNVADNSIGIPTGLREQFGAHDVVPNGDHGTTGSATRASTTLPLHFFSHDVAPNYFTRSIPFIAGATGTGAWTLNFQNGTDTAQAVTPTIAGAGVLPFANSVTISGNGASPTFNWTVPGTAGPDGVLIRIRDTSEFIGTGGVGGGGVANVIYAHAFPAGTASFTVNATDPNLTQPLQQGHTYSIEIALLDTRDGTSSVSGQSNLLSQSRAFFDFSLLSAGSPPNVFLPTLMTGAAPYYQFSVDNIVGGQQVFIDPLVATGYMYRIGAGDPNFASVLLPRGIGDDIFNLRLWNGTEFVNSGLLTGGNEYLFPSGGVDRFQILGIEPSAGVDPYDTTAFVTGLTFSGDGQFTGTMTPLAASVPEPATLALMGLGLAGMRITRRKQ